MTAKEVANFDEGVKLDRRGYVAPNGRRIYATLVLSGMLKRTLHEPARCLPDAGWIITGTDETTIRLENGREIQAGVMNVFCDVLDGGRLVRRSGLNIYWYEGAQGVSTPSYMMSNFISYRDAIFRNLNHRWGQVSFFLQMPDRRPEEITSPLDDMMALDDLRNFVAKAAPSFLTFVR